MANSTIIPAMEPPPGQVSNFVDPPYSGAKFVVVNCVFLPIALIALAVRTWTRVVVVRSVAWDDCKCYRAVHRAKLGKQTKLTKH